jgi:hypothetical protein
MLNSYQRNRLLLTLGAAAACALFWFAGRWFGIPEHPRYEISLALQPTPAVDLLVTGVVLCAATAVATAIAGSVRFDAGLFGAAIGLTALSVRGGPLRYITQSATGRGVFLAMALETVVLGALLGAAWFGLWLLHRRGNLRADALRDGLKDQPHALGDRVLALATHVGTTALLVLLLARTDDKKQVLASVALASFLATLLAYSVSPVRPSVWYWAGPLVTGAFGYVAAYFAWRTATPVDWKTGLGGGYLGALTRPLPLDYAGLGTAGAILGYWMSRQWQRAKELETNPDPAAASAP